MKVEIVSNFEDPAGLVTGTLATGAGAALVTTGDGQAILTAFAVLSDPDTHRAVRPSDGDAYLQALLSTLPDGYVFARIADDVTIGRVVDVAGVGPEPGSRWSARSSSEDERP